MARGYNAQADVLPRLADGTDPNALWDEFIAAVKLQNDQRSALVDLFTFRTSRKGDSVLQSPSGISEFEEASEYGVPQGLRLAADVLPMGYTFKWFDLAKRMTWRYLVDAPASQVEALHSAALAADNLLTFKGVMRRLFNPVNETNEDGTTVYGLWNGTDGQTPPEYNGNTFFETHNHYLTTGTATLDPADVEILIDTVLHHGYGDDDGSQIVVLAHPIQADVIAGYRVGVNGAKFDFIPSTDAPAYLTAETLVGNRPAGTFQGMRVAGSYGRALIVENSLMPVAYLASLASGGSNSDRNPIGFREHSQPSYQGLKLIPGSTPNYPLIDSYYTHGFGVGVRHRGAAAVMQVVASSTYIAPTAF
ncbi:hypothetical protein [Aeromicrobium endophyticum]|uniref:Phage major capsid protein n=1 Tax=Aeromicrobium endophyticum TaxID=2292704 RepID=A0A371P9F1_9ACTN|nr:hypothetical protein [Aeromicrobium endophyticum]REK72138.1 hypothetical protein DX116_00340 [Aeromicrobium endophyticum]